MYGLGPGGRRHGACGRAPHGRTAAPAGQDRQGKPTLNKERRPVTLVTGASSGLGADFARACARRGDEVLLVARRRDRLDELGREIGGSAHVLPMDLSQPGAAQALIGAVDALGFRVATLINNAGFGLAGRFPSLPLDRQRQMLELNVVTLTELCHLVLPGMVQQRQGAILNVASTGAFQPGPGIAVYFASKAYILSFTEALHQELKGSGIKVSALCPGPTATEFGDVAGVTNDRFHRFSARPKTVVTAALRGLARNQAVVVPGLTNKITAASNRFLPRAAMRRIVAGLKLRT
ncbi:SDR family NAD(P)-dependent oxidoreductase [Sphingosinicella rhizophila]|uniref:SDR family oxidoreductase n=1 Tax=Sphingosinicella rhizophila TaxID=3050082 RepID=A0ABU3Q9P4_9SPHN|nr:SDR family oxidoreductase [Sphingosinicella sp. GR2756]MDT9599665.1 SDR family oxidoreductase [Sphingosinicella sp. GR2756]